MKREENKKQEQNVQQKDKQIMAVRSGLRAGAVSSVRGCIDI